MKALLARGSKILTELEDAGFEGVFAGGIVRDLLCGLEPGDIDIACSAPLDTLRTLFPEGKILGPRGCEIFILPRAEGVFQLFSYAGSSLEKDLERRDLTVNALALRRRGELVGSPDGVTDIFARRLRFNGRGKDRLGEDPLRALRLLRFAATLPGFRADSSALELCGTARTALRECPVERVGREIRLGLEGKASLFLRGLQTTGLFASVFPAMVISGDDFSRLLEVEDILSEWNVPLSFKAAAMLSFSEEINPVDDERAAFAERIFSPLGWGDVLTRRISDLVRYRNLLRQAVPSEILASLMAEKQLSFFGELVHFSTALSSTGLFQPMLKENAEILLAMTMRKGMEEFFLPTGGEILRRFSLSQGRTVGLLRKMAEKENLERGFFDQQAVFDFLEREIEHNGREKEKK